MGAEDNNDTLPYEDAYDEHERQLTKDFYNTCSVCPRIGTCPEKGAEEIVRRFKLAKDIYEMKNMSAVFSIHKGIGHSNPREAIDKIVVFFENYENYIGETRLIWVE